MKINKRKPVQAIEQVFSALILLKKNVILLEKIEMNATTPNFESVWKILEQTSTLQAETSKQIQELKASQTETSEQIKGLKKVNPELIDLHFDYIEKKTARNHKKLEDDYDILMNESDVFIAEDFYFNTLKANPELNGLRFDYIEKNVTRSHKKLEDEFDILMVNGSDVFIIEVKYKAHKNDLERLLNKKAVNFKKLYPEFSNYRHHLGLATFHINDELKEEALQQGVTILQRKGKVIETYPA